MTERKLPLHAEIIASLTALAAASLVVYKINEKPQYSPSTTLTKSTAEVVWSPYLSENEKLFAISELQKQSVKIQALADEIYDKHQEALSKSAREEFQDAAKFKKVIAQSMSVGQPIDFYDETVKPQEADYLDLVFFFNQLAGEGFKSAFELTNDPLAYYGYAAMKKELQTLTKLAPDERLDSFQFMAAAIQATTYYLQPRKLGN